MPQPRVHFAFVVAWAIASGQVVAARAATGLIPLKANVDVAEIDQRAIIAFDGREQLMLVNSVVQAAEPVSVIRVLPFAAEPKVDSGNAEGFCQAAQIIGAGLPRRAAKALDISGFTGAAVAKKDDGAPPSSDKRPPSKQAAQVVNATQRAALDAAVAELAETWPGQTPMPPLLSKAIDEYRNDGYVWFVLQRMDVGAAPTAAPCLRLRFATDRLYYPLRIGRASADLTTVRLIMVSPRLLRMPEVGTPRVRLLHEPVPVSLDSLEQVDDKLKPFFGERPQVLVRLWEAKGRPPGFKYDIATVWY